MALTRRSAKRRQSLISQTFVKYYNENNSLGKWYYFTAFLEHQTQFNAAMKTNIDVN